MAELKPLVFSISDLAFVDEQTPQPNFQNPHNHAVYKATEVEAAIAELKAENKLLKEHIANGDVSRITWIDEVIELKQKLENVKATAYAESVDAGMRERRMKRALWLTRTEMARTSAWVFWNRKDDYNYNKWKKIEFKCRKKAEEYK